MKKASHWTFYLIVVLTTLVVAPLVALIAVSIWTWFKLPDLDSLTDYKLSIPMTVYTADGFILEKIGEKRHAAVKIEDVPIALKQAILAAEDERFYQHMGINQNEFLRMIRADPFAHGHKQGTSTITMQVARYLCSSLPKKDLSSMRHHLYVILLALKIELHFSKDQIFEIYVNQTHFGRNAHGFDTAARIFFDKPLSEISFAEATMVAGLPRGLSGLDPVSDMRQAKERQNHVLKRMRNVGFIDEMTYQKALVEPLQMVSRGTMCEDSPPNDPADELNADYVVEMARQIVVEQYGEQAVQEGIKVITTITRADQRAAYVALRQSVMRHGRRYDYRGPERYLDLPDGELDREKIDDVLARALDSNSRLRDYGDLLLAVLVDVQPNEREITVYRDGTFLKIAGEGLTFALPMLKSSAPQSRQLRRGALVYIRYCPIRKGWGVTQIPDVDAALVSIDSRTGAVRALVGGFDFNYNQFNNVISTRQCESQIGCLTPPWEVAATYARYANGGYHIKPFIVREIQDADGNTLARFDPPTAGEGARRVIDARIASAVNLMHQDGVQRGESTRPPILNRTDIASKTGTAIDHSSFWFCGYNPGIVAVAWIGFSGPISMQRGGEAVDRTAAYPIWHGYMQNVLANVPNIPFSRPENLSGGDSARPSALADSGDYSGLLPARRRGSVQ
jgi:penicillin-binding protein 1A